MSSADGALAVGAPRPALGAWLRLARVSNTPTVVSNVLAGACLAAAAPAAGPVVLCAAALVLVYVAGMVLNDLLDLEEDRRERPSRPLPSGQVAPGAAGVAVVALLAAGTLPLLLVGLAPFAAGLGLVALVVAYDLRHDGPLSPVLMAGCRAAVYVVAALAVAGALEGGVVLAAALLGVYVASLTQVAKAETGGRVARLWPVALLLAPAAALFATGPGPVAGAALAASAAWTLHSASFVRRGDVGGAVGRLIAGIALLDAVAIAAADGPPAALALACGAFGACLLLQRHVPGT